MHPGKNEVSLLYSGELEPVSVVVDIQAGL